MATSNNYQFIPAYYEWHFTDGNGKVLANWNDPVESLYKEFDNETGEPYDDPQLMTDKDEIELECESFIDTGTMLFDEGETEYNGIARADFERLPQNAAAIMAEALYNYYVA